MILGLMKSLIPTVPVTVRLIFLIAVCFAFLPTVDGQNKVGINTTEPLGDLDVRGTDDNLDGGELQLATPSQSNFLRFFGGRLDDRNPFLAFHDLDTFHIATTLPDWSTYTRRLTLLPGGQLGLGTDNPSAKLDIAGQGDGLEMLRLSTERPWVFKQRNTGINTRLSLQSTIDKKSFDILAENGTSRIAEFHADNIDSRVLLVPDQGRVGIGVDTVDAKLHIRSDLSFNSALLAEGTGYAPDQPVIYSKVLNYSGTAIKGESSLGGHGVYGVSGGTGGVGVYGYASGNNVHGVHAEIDSENGDAILAESNSPTGQNKAIWASNDSDEGVGVYAVTNASTGPTISLSGWNYSSSGTAVRGIASATSGTTIGVNGIAYSAEGIGVYGNANATSGLTYGVLGYVNSPSGIAIYGSSNALSGTTYGAYGSSKSSSGIGVFGYATASSGDTKGVYGNSSSPTGTGIYGVANSTSGNTRGVAGFTYSPNGTGVIGQASYSSGPNIGVHGISTSSEGKGVYGVVTAGTGTTYGVHGKVSSDGSGVYGENTSTTGPSTGVYGKSVSTSGIGVFAASSSSSGTTYGVWATTPSTSGTGVYGIVNATTGTTNGLYGHSLSADGRGVYGNASGANGKALYGYATGTYGKGLHVEATGTHSSVNAILAVGNQGDAYAGYFVGRVHVAGTLSKSSGSFKIDHPLDPENKYLYHSFVESPDMMNIYNGNVVTDKEGFATIALPEYFDALNMDFRYQLTVIGTFAQAIISEEISENAFTIRTDQPNTKVSWQVTGVRKDAWAQKHRLQPEVAKEPENIGKYLNPEVHGKAETARIGYSKTPPPKS